MSETSVKALTIENRDGLPIHGDLHLPDGVAEPPLVLVAHGFKGFKDWGFFPWLASSLAEQGFAAFRLNFARNGVDIGKPSEFTRLDLFEENSITREVADLEDLIDAIPGHEGFQAVRRERFGLFGHSRGGAEAILAASRRSEIASLATWAAVSRFARHFDEATLAAWKEEGRFSVLNSRTGQQMPLGMELWRDLAERGEEIDVLAAEERLSIPHLVLHGEKDESVDPAAAREILDASGGKATLSLIPGTGHTFGAVHPFPGPTPELEQAFRATTLHFRVSL